MDAIRASALVDSLGVNTHIDFQNYGYQNFAITEASINYLGLKNLRDDPENPADVGANGWWQQVANATGAKFDAFLAEGSVAQMQSDLTRAQQLAGQGILTAIEGGNEEDDPYAQQNGNSLAAAAAEQQQVWSVAHAAGLPAINMSFGQGWTATNNWHGNYDKVGDLSPYADYANAHTYATGAPASTIALLNSDALLAAAGRPIMQTEFGYDTNQIDATAAAKYSLDGVLDSYLAGDAKTYFYALFDDGSGNFGLMNQDGTPKPAGKAIHDLTTLLADPGAAAGSFTPGSLPLSLTSTTAGDQSLLMEKSDGSYWLAVWNEQQALGASHTITVTLGSPAAMQEFDPLTGTAAVSSVSGASSMALSVPDHPVLVEITPAGGGTGVTPPPSGGALPLDDTDMLVTVPGSQEVTAGAALAISGVAIDDPWAAGMGGTMALNVYDTSGTIEIAGQTFGPGGDKVAGGMVTGTLAQLNADLASLKYTAGPAAGTDTLYVDVWNQGGFEVTKQIAVSTTAATQDPPPPTDPPPAIPFTREPWQQPFAADSPWNIGIGSGAQWEDPTSAVVQKLHSLNGIINTTDWSLPIYVGTASDPLVTIVTTNDALGPVQIHIPASAVPSGGDDRCMSFFDTTQPGKVWTFDYVQFNNGHDITGGATALLGSVFDTAGDGFTNPSYNPGQVGANYVGGVITPYDLSKGSITHMLRIALGDADEAMPAGSTWDTNLPFPVTAVDFNGPTAYTGVIPAGSTFGIPASVDLSKLGLSQGGMMLAQALQEYGAVWADTAGNGNFTIYSEPSTQSNPLMQQAEADMSKLMPYLSVLTNQSAATVNGGGTYAAPPPPPFDPSLGIGSGETPVDGTTPPAGGTAGPVTIGTGPDSLVLSISEDSLIHADGVSDASGDAAFTVSIDGKQLGGTLTALAQHSAGTDQTFTFNGSFGPGSHTVEVNFVNDAWTPNTPDVNGSTDRNLYVDGVTYLGKTTGQSAGMVSSGPQDFTVTGGTAPSGGNPPPPPNNPAPVLTGAGPDSLTLSISEDALITADGSADQAGDATFTVTIDGKQLGGTFTALASHATGADQTFTFDGTFGSGPHVVAVDFLNDAWAPNSPDANGATDRNLYVGKVAFLGSDTGQSAVMDSAGPTSFNVTGGTNPAPPAITLTPSDLTPSVSASNSTVTGVGSFTAYIGGSGDTVSLTGGAERLMLFGRTTTATTGTGDDTLYLASTGNVVNAGAGANRIVDSSGGNTIVLPAAGNGTDDVWGSVLSDTLDFRSLLAGTGYTAGTFSKFVSIGTAANGTDAVISARSTSGGSAVPVATLHGQAGMTMATLQAHSHVT